MSVLATGLLAAALILGGNAELLNVQASFDVTGTKVEVGIEPVIVVWMKGLPHNGMTFGNVILAYDRLRGTDREPILLDHELAHVAQYQSLGWFVYTASLSGRIEAGAHDATWDSLGSHTGSMMELVTAQTWSFLSFSYDNE